MAGSGSSTGAKRQKERQRAEKQALKQEKYAKRKLEGGKKEKPTDGSDPDIAGIVAGPQPIVEDAGD